MQRVLIIDNFDSFTYNLVQLVQELTGTRPDVVRNHVLTPDLYEKYEAFILSPGPGIPEEAGELKNFIEQFPKGKKLLGVCLGHQAIVEVLGGKLQQLEKVYHGVEDEINITCEDTLFENMNSTFLAGRYHSWHVSGELPEELEVICEDEHGIIMGIRHKTEKIRGIQFHPESVMTPDGKTILNNFLKD